MRPTAVLTANGSPEVGTADCDPVGTTDCGLVGTADSDPLMTLSETS